MDESPTIADAADELMDRLNELEGIAQMIDRGLYHPEGAEQARARLAVRGILRLANEAGDAAIALADRLSPRGRALVFDGSYHPPGWPSVSD